MTIYKGCVNFDKITVKDGDEFIGCNPSKMGDPRVIAAKNLKFTKCNMFNVATDPTWTVDDDCPHYGKTVADLPPEPTETERATEEIQQLTDKLEVLAKTYPVIVKEKIDATVDLKAVTVEEPIIKVVG